MCIAIPESDAAKAKKAADELFAYEISLGKVDPLKVEKGFSIISLVGDDLKNQSGASGRMFDALGREGINIRAIAQGSSEKNVSTVLHTEDVKAAIRAIHKEFFSGKGRRINLFFAGCGTVGSALIDMINRQHDFISNQLGKDLVICGLADSKNYITARDGVKIAAEKKENKNTKELSKDDIKNYKLDNIIMLSTLQLGQGKNLHVVETNGKKILVGSTANSVNIIKDLGEDEEFMEENPKEKIEDSKNESVCNSKILLTISAILTVSI
jgi:hypothetical protein